MISKYVSAIAIALLMCGCEPPKPSTREDYSAHAAVTLGQASIDSSPAPSPGPSPSDGKCKNCKGVGKVGDGRTMLTCDVCKGTGKETISSLPPADVLECPGGVCYPHEHVITAPILTEGIKSLLDDPEAYEIPRLPYKPPEPIKSIEQPKADPPKPIKPTITMWTHPSCHWCDEWKLRESHHFRKAGWTIEEKTSGLMKTPRFEVKDSKRQFTYTGYMTPDQFNAKYYETSAGGR